MSPIASEAKAQWIRELLEEGELVIDDPELKAKYLKVHPERDPKAMEPKEDPFATPPWEEG